MKVEQLTFKQVRAGDRFYCDGAEYIKVNGESKGCNLKSGRLRSFDGSEQVSQAGPQSACALDQIAQGECFIFNEHIHIKTGDTSGCDLHTGRMIAFTREYGVMPVLARVVIE